MTKIDRIIFIQRNINLNIFNYFLFVLMCVCKRKKERSFRSMSTRGQELAIAIAQGTNAETLTQYQVKSLIKWQCFMRFC